MDQGQHGQRGWLQACHCVPKSFSCPRLGALSDQIRDLIAVGLLTAEMRL